MERVDLFVVGGGSGGVRGARAAAARGAKVALAEKAQLGGTCVNIGCVPKKLFYFAAGFADEAQQAAAYGYPDADLGDFNWHTLRDNKNAEIRRLNAIYADLLRTAGVQTFAAAAQLQDANTVICGDQTVRAERILLATGGAPARLNIPGGEHAVVSDDLFFLPELPKRVALLGGGYIALEFAGIFAGLGVATTLCYRADLPLRGLDDDIRQRVADGMTARGIAIKNGASPVAIRADAGGKTIVFDDGAEVAADLVVFATGRKPNTAALGLESAGIVARGNGTLAVDDSFRTECPSVYAVGDLLQTPALTPVAIAEADTFVRRVYGGDADAAVDYATLPTAIFSRPGIATAGLSESAARRAGRAIRVYADSFSPMKSKFGGQAEASAVKLIVDADSDRVIGAAMVGDSAAEIMQGIAVAIAAGATKAVFDRVIGIHPTSAEEFVTLRREQ